MGATLRACLLVLLSAASGLAAPARGAGEPIAGGWRGHATFRGASLELSVHFQGAGPKLQATLDCPDMMILGQPLEGVVQAGRRVRFATPQSPSLRFDCVRVGDTLRGSAVAPAVPGVVERGRGGDSTVALALARITARSSPPYVARDVSFGHAGIRLAGTLLIPASATPVPGVVLLQGSSANLRRDYRFYADYFARLGLAVLAFDKRGFGESTGDYGAATYDDLAADAAAAVACLRSQQSVDSSRVGVWGLSQGAFIAPLVATRVPSLRFIVAVSAPGMPVGESAAYQDSARLAAAGFDAADIRRAVSLDGRLYDWLRTRDGADELGALLAEAADTPWRRASSLPHRLPAGAALEGWYWRGRTLDPAPLWRAVRVPVLLIHGAADELVPGGASSRLIARALKKGGNRDVVVRVFPDANHVLRTLPLVAGGAWDWPRAAPGYLELTADWMRSHAGLAAVR